MKKSMVLILIFLLSFVGFAELTSWKSFESSRTEINRGLNATDENTTFSDSLRDYLADGLLVDGTLAISTAPAEDFKTSSISTYTIGGITYTKSAIDSMSFTEAYTVNAGADSIAVWGVFLVQVNAGGTVSTLAPSADQVYADSLTAISALPSATASNVRLGYILIQNGYESAWTANTSDMTPASDCLQSVFVDYPVKVLPTAR